MRNLFIVLTLLLVGCGPDPDMPLQKKAPAVAVADTNHIAVTRVGVFEDELAYGSRRGVYLIKDNQTGIEYIGISGIGINERGCHWISTGKTGHCSQHED